VKIYVASSWRNQEQPNVVAFLRSAGHEVYDFRRPSSGDDGFHWGEIDLRWEGWTTGEYVRALDHEIAAAGFESDFDAMKWADACVLLLPCGRSAHLEAGYFVGASKPLHIYIPVSRTEPELMYKMATGVHTELADLLGALRP